MLQNSYDPIAEEYSNSRINLFPEIIEQLSLEQGDRSVLDLGCGNGIVANYLSPTINYLGIDDSAQLLKIASGLHPDRNFQAGDLKTKAAYPTTQKFDLVISLSLLHHFQSPSRLLFFKQVSNLVKDSGRILISIWNLDLPKFDQYQTSSQTLQIPYHNTKVKRTFFRIKPQELIDEASINQLTLIKQIKVKGNFLFTFKPNGTSFTP